MTSPTAFFCPTCRRPALWEGNPFRPFCCERCRLVDLGAWIDESYRVADESQSATTDKLYNNNEDLET